MRIITLLATSILSINLSAQIWDPGFDNIVFTSGDCAANNNPSAQPTSNTSPFAACAFEGWTASHGTPEIYWEGGSFDNKRAAMWSGYWDESGIFGGEGIYSKCYFIKDKTYRITFRMRTSTTSGSAPEVENFISNVHVKLSTVLPIVTTVNYTPTSSLYAIPSVTASQTLLHLTNFSSPNSYQFYDFYFTPNATNYNSLWIYPEHSNGDSKVSVLIIDDVVIEDCLLKEEYSNTSSLPAMTARSSYIQASNNTHVLSGQRVTFTAGNYIYLDPKFVADYGSVFNAFIGGCQKLDCVDPDWRIAGDASPPGYPLEAKVNIYPNPTKGDFKLARISSEPCNIYVCDMLGNVVLDKLVVTDRIIDFSLKDYPSGIYLIKIRSSDELIIKKIMKE